ncbi:HEAT repeat domain-containing protein [Ktedonobacter racemifer]|uniref:WD40 repeat, subgroup n=1 Tax=Ktedonobacter racemifer DSM 44963 TaxID=485913 RepID=D6TRP5_KTERA|nr:HEAT repeat domain-containing protein [Ktedonobacter racemifer]EFH85997.1 WD40 repeat, subgroup [Ktedonobacter racemifer DSM 44963]
MEFDAYRSQLNRGEQEPSSVPATPPGGISASSEPPVLAHLGLGKVRHQARALSHDQLRAALQQENWQQKVMALRELARRQEDIAPEVLLAALHDEHEAVRAAAVRALGSRGERASLSILAEALRDEQWQVRAEAARALGKQGQRAPLDLLGKSWHDTDPTVRAAVIWSLGQMGERAPVNILVEGLTDESDLVREAAIHALGELNEQVSLEPFVRAQLDQADHERGLEDGAPKRHMAQTPSVSSTNTDSLLLPLTEPALSFEQTGTPSAQSDNSEGLSTSVVEAEQVAEDVPQEQVSRPEWTTGAERRGGRARAKYRERAPHWVAPWQQWGGRLLAVALLLFIIGGWLSLRSWTHPPAAGVGRTETYFSYVNARSIEKVSWAPTAYRGARHGQHLLAFADEAGYIQVCDVAHQVCDKSFGVFGSVLAMQWSQDGLTIVDLNLNQQLVVTRIFVNYQGSDTQSNYTLPGEANRYSVATLSRDGNTIALALNSTDSVTGARGRVQLWHWNNRTPFTTYPTLNLRVTALAFSDDAAMLAIASSTPEMVNNGNTLEIVGHGILLPVGPAYPTYALDSLAWSPDSMYLIGTNGQDGAKRWLLKQFAADGIVLVNGKASVVSAWSPLQSLNLLRFATASSDGSIQICDPSGCADGSFEQHKHIVTDVAWAPDGAQVASVDENGTLFVWGVKN